MVYLAARYMGQETLDRGSLLIRLHIYVLQEKWTEAGEVLSAFDWNNAKQKKLRYTPKDIVSSLKKLPFDCRYLTVLESFEKDTQFFAAVYKEFEQCSLDEQDRLMAYLRSLPLRGLTMCRHHLAYAGSRNDVRLAASVLETMREKNLPFFLKDGDYWDSLYQLDIDINSYMVAVSGYDWMESVRKLWAQVPINTCETVYLCLIRGLEKTDVRYTFLSALMIEKRLFANAEPEEEEIALETEDTEISAPLEIAEDETNLGAEDTEVSALPEATEDEANLDAEDVENSVLSETAEWEAAVAPAQDEMHKVKRPQPAWMSLTPEEVWNELNRLSQYWTTCAATLYREEVFVGNLLRNLPSAYQFGWYIMQANAVKNQNTNLFLIKVADAAKAYPTMKELCIKVITAYKEEG